MDRTLKLLTFGCVAIMIACFAAMTPTARNHARPYWQAQKRIERQQVRKRLLEKYGR